MIHRQKLRGLVLLIAATTALVGAASYLRLIAIEFGGNTGLWGQLAAQNGRVRVVLIRPIGPMSEGHARIRSDYQQFWRTRYLPGHSRMNQFSTIYEGGTIPIFREYAVDATAFLPSYLLLAAYVSIWHLLPSSQTVRKSFWELWRPRNALDRSRLIRRYFRKAVYTVLFISAVAGGVDAVQGITSKPDLLLRLRRSASSYFFPGHLRTYYVGGLARKSPLKGNSLISTSPFQYTRLRITHTTSSWEFEFHDRLPCGVSGTAIGWAFGGFGLIRADLERVHSFDFCGCAFLIEEQIFQNPPEPPVPVKVPHFEGTKPVAVAIIIPTWFPAVVLWMFLFLVYWRGPFRRAKWRLADRCSACGYHLEGLTEARCPECAEPVLASSIG